MTNPIVELGEVYEFRFGGALCTGTAVRKVNSDYFTFRAPGGMFVVPVTDVERKVER